MGLSSVRKKGKFYNLSSDQVSLKPCYSLLQEIHRYSYNKICADCSAENPDWCSLNLGVIICIGKEKN